MGFGSILCFGTAPESIDTTLFVIVSAPRLHDQPRRLDAQMHKMVPARSPFCAYVLAADTPFPTSAFFRGSPAAVLGIRRSKQKHVRSKQPRIPTLLQLPNLLITPLVATLIPRVAGFLDWSSSKQRDTRIQQKKFCG